MSTSWIRDPRDKAQIGMLQAQIDVRRRDIQDLTSRLRKKKAEIRKRQQKVSSEIQSSKGSTLVSE